jgi:hypothetical protein
MNIMDQNNSRNFSNYNNNNFSNEDSFTENINNNNQIKNFNNNLGSNNNNNLSDKISIIKILISNYMKEKELDT